MFRQLIMLLQHRGKHADLKTYSQTISVFCSDGSSRSVKNKDLFTRNPPSLAIEIKPGSVLKVLDSWLEVWNILME